MSVAALALMPARVARHRASGAAAARGTCRGGAPTVPADCAERGARGQGDGAESNQIVCVPATCVLLSSGPLGGCRVHAMVRGQVNVVFGNRHGSVRGSADSGNSGCGRWEAREVSAENGTVVVVEDDPHIADLVDLYLRREGFRVLLAGDGEKGLESSPRRTPGSSSSTSACPGPRRLRGLPRDPRPQLGARPLPHGARRRGRPHPRAGAGRRRLPGQAVLARGSWWRGCGPSCGGPGRARRRRT